MNLYLQKCLNPTSSWGLICCASFSSVQSLSRVQLFATPWIVACQASLSITWDSRPLNQWCHPAISSYVIPFSSCPQSLPASVFSSESTLSMRWPKYWSFSFSIIPSKEIPGLISFRMDWLDLLAVQGLICTQVSTCNNIECNRICNWKIFLK